MKRGLQRYAERACGQTLVAEPWLVGDFGQAEFRNRQIRHRPAACGLRHDKRRVRRTEHVHVPPIFGDPHGIAVLDDRIAAARDQFRRDARIDLHFLLIPCSQRGRTLHRHIGVGEGVTVVVQHIDGVGVAIHDEIDAA